MLSPSNGVSRTGSLAELLATTTPAPSMNPSPEFSGRFSSALAASLEELGLDPGRVQVTVQQTGSTERRFVITFEGSAPLAELSAEHAVSTGEASAPEIPPYDPNLGPVITKEMWTNQMLTGELTQEMLRNIVDPAEFLNARLAALQKPTSARVRSASEESSQPLNASHLSTREQAEAMLERLRSLGIEAGEIQEVAPKEGPFTVDYAGETRRHFSVGEMNVGLLLERYAKYTKETADQMTQAEFSRASPS